MTVPSSPDERTEAGLPVLHIISSLEVGGAERLLIETLRCGRTQFSHPFVVVVMNDRVDDAMRAELGAIGYPVYYFGRSPGHLHPRYLRDLVSIIRRHGIRVVHAHNKGAKVWAGSCKAFVGRLKVVFTVHDTMAFRSPSGRAVALHRLLVDHTIAISEAVLQQCTRARLGPVTLVPNGIDLTRFGTNRPLSWSTPPRLICVGRLAPKEKGQDLLIEALALLKARGYTPMCLFVGPETRREPPTCGHQLRDQVVAAGVSQQVSFVTDCSDVSTLLPDADILVLPSRFEGFGLAALEGMAAGLPCVVCDKGGPPLLVRDGIEGLHFRTGSAEALADRLQRMLDDPARAMAMGVAAVERAKVFDIRTMIASYLSIYARLDDKASRGRRVE